jgi:hypothetical protein
MYGFPACFDEVNFKNWIPILLPKLTSLGVNWVLLEQ